MNGIFYAFLKRQSRFLVTLNFVATSEIAFFCNFFKITDDSVSLFLSRDFLLLIKAFRTFFSLKFPILQFW